MKLLRFLLEIKEEFDYRSGAESKNGRLKQQSFYQGRG